MENGTPKKNAGKFPTNPMQRRSSLWPEPVKKNLEAPDLVDTQNQAVIEARREGLDALAARERASIRIAIVGSVSTTPTRDLKGIVS